MRTKRSYREEWKKKEMQKGSENKGEKNMIKENKEK